MRFAKLLGGVGRFLIWAGVIILLFVGYQLWGTNIAESRAQNDLESEFSDLLEDTGPTAPSTTTTTSSPDEQPDEEPGPDPVADIEVPEAGEPLARIRIPAIGVDKIVVQGVGRGDLRKGPGHYPETPLPGQSGNASIAGHRTTYGAPFHRVDELEEGDRIVVTTQQGEFNYFVSEQEIVAPSAVEVLEDKGDDRLTLTSCHPKYSARERIIITAMLGDPPAPPTRPPRDLAEEIKTIDGEETGPLAPAIILGLVALAVWLAFYALSRRWRRWPAYVLGIVPFGASLFFWFGAVADLLPSNF